MEFCARTSTLLVCCFWLSLISRDFLFDLFCLIRFVIRIRVIMLISRQIGIKAKNQCTTIRIRILLLFAFIYLFNAGLQQWVVRASVSRLCVFVPSCSILQKNFALVTAPDRPLCPELCTDLRTLHQQLQTTLKKL